MLIDRQLAESVLASENAVDLSADDLRNAPYEKMVLEFSSPVTFIEHNGQSLQAVAVGFWIDLSSKYTAVVWYTDQSVTIDGHPWAQTVTLMMGFGYDRRVVWDDVPRRKLSLHPEQYGCGQIGGTITWSGGDEKIKAFTDTSLEARSKIILSTRNIWDFITCRNIDYETQSRKPLDFKRFRRYQHIQGQFSPHKRQYKIIKVNKVVEKRERREEPEPWHPTKRVHVPGCFHKLIYCESCNDLHRHDLIGHPCRKCAKQVGPLSNLVVKKYWHRDHWKGEGEAIQTVYEIER